MERSYPLPREVKAASLRERRTGALGRWRPYLRSDSSIGAPETLAARLDLPLYVIENDGRLETRSPENGELTGDENGDPVVGFVPALLPDQLGDRSFCEDHGLSWAYLTGAMANGIGSAEIVEAMGQSGMLGFFGAAGLDPVTVAAAIDRIQARLGDKPYGFNLIHTPQEPGWEDQIVDLYLEKRVRLVEASAYLDLTLPVVRYRVFGIHRDESGRIVAPNRLIAKVSRIEVAAKFFAPPPQKYLERLVERGEISRSQALLARHIPMAQDITAEADSGGHTDNRPAVALFPTLAALRDRMQVEFGYDMPLRLGLGGGIATPASAAAAFAMGAAFVVTGSINQACVEAGTSEAVKAMLAETEQADIAMAPAADMFEMGVKLQVLKRGTMFAMRAGKLYDFYQRFEGIEAIPAKEREWLEKTLFRADLEEIWCQTRAFFQTRDPRQIERAERDPKHRMALVFRWYLGLSSHWANRGEPSRRIDYQIWCGPAMGAFNEWTKGSFLESAAERRVVVLARNILFGAAYLSRINSLRVQGCFFSGDGFRVAPRELGELKEFFT